VSSCLVCSLRLGHWHGAAPRPQHAEPVLVTFDINTVVVHVLVMVRWGI